MEGTKQAIVLRDLSETELLNTQTEFGSSHTQAVPLSSEDLSDLKRGRPRISDVYASPITNENQIAVIRPISLRDGTPAVLAITMPTFALHQVLNPSVPAGWVVGVGDRKGVYVTRSERHADVSGKPGVAAYLRQAVGPSGSFTATNQFGEELLAGYLRSGFSGWLYAANVPLATVEAPL